MRILHIVESCVGGTAVYLDLLIRKQLERAGCEVILLCDVGRMDPLLHKLPIEIVGFESERSIISALKTPFSIRTTVNHINPDIVHTHGSFAGLYARILNVFFRSKFKYVHCAHGWSFTQSCSRHKKWIYAMMERLLSNRTDAIVNISESEATAARHYGVLARFNATIEHVVRNACYSSGQEHYRVNGAFNVGFVGRFDEQKGIDLLLKAWQGIVGQDMFLHIIGAPDRNDFDLEPYEKLENTKFYGWIDNNEIDDYLSSFDVLVIPSRWEGFGLVCIESLRNGTPVIAADVGGLGEIIRKSGAGVLVPANSSECIAKELLEMSNFSDYYYELKGKCIPAYDQFYSGNSSDEKLFGLYQKVMEH